MVQVNSILHKLEEDKLTELSAGGEPTFVTLSSTFSYLHNIVGTFARGSADEAAVGEAHRRFCEKMLARRSFNAMLTLVRETEGQTLHCLFNLGAQSIELAGMTGTPIHSANNATPESLPPYGALILET